MVTNETLNHKNPVTGERQTIGLGWLDDSMQLTGENHKLIARLREVRGDWTLNIDVALRCCEQVPQKRIHII